MEAITMYLSQNKPHLFTQHKFHSFVTLTCTLRVATWGWPKYRPKHIAYM